MLWCCVEFVAIFMEFSFPLFRHFNLKCLHVSNAKCTSTQCSSMESTLTEPTTYTKPNEQTTVFTLIIIFWAPYNKPNRMLKLKLEFGVANRTQNIRQPNIWWSRLLKLLTYFCFENAVPNATHFNSFIFSLMSTKLNTSQTIHCHTLKKIK